MGYSALLQIFQLLGEEHGQEPFFIAGESYGGKYVPTVAYRVHQENAKLPKGDKRFMNLKGIALGDPMSAPLTQMHIWSTNLYEGGLLDSRQAAEVEANMQSSADFA